MPILELTDDEAVDLGSLVAAVVKLYGRFLEPDHFERLRGVGLRIAASYPGIARRIEHGAARLRERQRRRQQGERGERGRGL